MEQTVREIREKIEQLTFRGRELERDVKHIEDEELDETEYKKIQGALDEANHKLGDVFYLLSKITRKL